MRVSATEVLGRAAALAGLGHDARPIALADALALIERAMPALSTLRIAAR